MDKAADDHIEVSSAIAKFERAVTAMRGQEIEEFSGALNKEVQAVHGFHGDKTAIATQALRVATVRLGMAITDLQVFRQIRVDSDTYTSDLRWSFPPTHRVMVHGVQGGPTAPEFSWSGSTRVLEAVDPDFHETTFESEWGVDNLNPASVDATDLLTKSTTIVDVRIFAKNFQEVNDWDWKVKLTFHVLLSAVPSNKFVIWTTEVEAGVAVKVVSHQIMDFTHLPSMLGTHRLVCEMYVPAKYYTSYDATSYYRVSVNSETAASVGTYRVDMTTGSALIKTGMDPALVIPTFRRYGTPGLSEQVPLEATWIDYLGELAPRAFLDNPQISLHALWQKMVSEIALGINTGLTLVKNEATAAVTAEKYLAIVPTFTFKSLIPVENWLIAYEDNPFTGLSKSNKTCLMKAILGDLESFRVALGADEKLAKKFLTMTGLPVQPAPGEYVSYL
jgi:hypothetical protein